jgi:hypothetical protein
MRKYLRSAVLAVLAAAAVFNLIGIRNPICRLRDERDAILQSMM